MKSSRATSLILLATWFGGGAFSARQAFAHDIITTNLTYTRDISRIIATRCAACHASGSSIPLDSYEAVRPWAVDIKEQVLSRQMPPWGAVKGFGDLSPDPGLTQEELLLIAGWVVGGAPKGDPAFLPSLKSLKAPQPHAGTAPLHDALLVSGRIQLKSRLNVAAVRPMTTDPIESARITASLPDGRVLPLVWLFHYDPKWNSTFQFRSDIVLPAGSVVQASAPLPFTLLVR